MDTITIIPLRRHPPFRLVGGKALTLSQLLRSGFSVPDGYVVTTNAYNKPTPELKKQILQHFDALDAPFVAVRSSAMAEDGKDASWAGQLDTYLNVTREDLFQRVQDCWASAGSARATAYAAEKNLPGGKVAVVVQRMIDSELSGVAFSTHPITQDPKHVVIEAGYGLGEAIVSGEITPDTYILDKKRGEVVEQHIANQTKKLVREENGKTGWQPIEEDGKTPKLLPAQLTALCSTVRRLELFFGHPVDVEWAFCEGRIYVLQSRPITTLGQNKKER